MSLFLERVFYFLNSAITQKPFLIAACFCKFPLLISNFSTPATSSKKAHQKGLTKKLRLVISALAAFLKNTSND